MGTKRQNITDRCRVEAALVLSDRHSVQRGAFADPFPQRPVQVEPRIRADKALRKLGRLSEEEVSPDRRCAMLIEAFVDGSSRDDVEKREPSHGIRIVKRKPSRYTRPSVVCDDREPSAVGSHPNLV
jgi:hypothetical protein